MCSCAELAKYNKQVILVLSGKQNEMREACFILNISTVTDWVYLLVAERNCELGLKMVFMLFSVGILTAGFLVLTLSLHFSLGDLHTLTLVIDAAHTYKNIYTIT